MNWSDWVGKHAAAFGFGAFPRSAELEMGMLAEWTHIFARAGFTPEQACEATDRLAIGEHPEFRRDHLKALLELLRGMRPAEAYRPPPGEPSCKLCDDTAFVCGLPSRAAMAKGGEGFETVCCRCRMGRARAENLRDLRPPTIDAYEEEVPDWRTVLRRWREAAEAEGCAAGRAGELDRQLGRIMTRLRGRLNAPPAGG